MKKCVCKATDYDGLISRAVSDCLKAVAATKGSIAVVRNGGWEQWLRNHLLIELEREGGAWGFTEARNHKVMRADLIFNCATCGHIRFAVEVKTNFAIQGATVINDRVSESIGQLEAFVRAGVPSYIVYSLTRLRGDPKSGLVRAQNTAFTPSYKHFDQLAGGWPAVKGVVHLPADRYVLSGIPGEGANAEVRVWTASVGRDPTRASLRQLSFLSQEMAALQQSWGKKSGSRWRKVPSAAER